MLSLRLLGASLITAYSLSCFGDTEEGHETVDLTTLSLEELLNIRVVSANKRDESIFSAPGVVTNWNRTDIRLLGAENLAELADLTPGWFSYKNIGEYTFVTRGQKSSGFDNNRHLVLLDGISVNHARANTAPADSRLPIDSAENIEFLRGPASALYGESAFYGVINITSQQASADSAASGFVDVELSNRQDDQRIYGQLLSSQRVLDLGLHFSHQRQTATEDPINENIDHRNYDDQNTSFLYLTLSPKQESLSGFTLGAYHSEKEGGLGNFWASYSSPQNQIKWQTSLLYLKHDLAINDNIEFRSYLKYNTSTEASRYVNESGNAFSSYNYRFHDYEIQSELLSQLSDKHSIISGFNYDTRYGEEAEVIVNDQQRSTPRTPTLEKRSVWSQYQGDFGHSQLTLGVRHDAGSYGSGSYIHNSPRVSLVQRVTDKINLKILYGEALRGPSVKELGVNNEVLIENAGLELAPLQPETVVTYEFSPYFKSDSSLLSLTWFSTRTKDFIGRDWSNLGEYVNEPGLMDSDGFEIEFNHLLNARTKLLANYSRSRSKDDQGMHVQDLPENQLNLGVLWQGRESLPLSGSVTVQRVGGFSAEPDSDINAEAYNLLSLNLLYNLSDKIAFGVELNNIGNERAFMPLNSERSVQLRERELVFSFEYSAF